VTPSPVTLSDVVFVVGGGGALLAAALPRLLHGRPLSLPLVYLTLGVALWALPLPLPDLDPVARRVETEHLTEVCVIVALMGAGLALDRPVGWRRWGSTWRLLAVAMPVTVGLVAALASGLGWPLASALLLGAVLAPTDPVLASDVQVGEPTDHEDAEDEVRFALTSEAGLNDGLAFPLVYAAVAVAAGGSLLTGALEWVLVDVLFRTAAGLATGLFVGWGLGRLFFLRAAPTLRLSAHADGFVALAVTFLAYGVAEIVGGYGFVAVFVAATRIRAAERAHGYHRVLHGFIEQVERVLVAWLLLLLGGAIASGLLAPLTAADVAVALGLLLVARPAAVLLATAGSHHLGPRQRAVVSFFGIRGIGSLFYLAYALGEAHLGVAPERLWAVVGFVVLASVVLHGVTATPAMAALDLRMRGARVARR
jgi:sodium/hydrogen antiporter